MTFVIRYIESDKEVAEELEFIASRRPDEDPVVIYARYAPLYLCRSRRPDEPYDLCGTDVPLMDDALTFISRDDAVSYINAIANPEQGTYIIEEHS